MPYYNWSSFIPVHYFLEDSFVGTGYHPETFHGKPEGKLWFWAPHSWFCFCPCCGKIWARGLSTHPKARHHAMRVPCAEHGGGSLVMISDDVDWEGMPRTKEFMMYELGLYLRDPLNYEHRRFGVKCDDQARI